MRSSALEKSKEKRGLLWLETEASGYDGWNGLQSSKTQSEDGVNTARKAENTERTREQSRGPNFLRLGYSHPKGFYRVKCKLLPLFRKYRVPLKHFLNQNGLKWGSSYHVVKAKIHVSFLSVRKQVLMQVFCTSEATFRELSDSRVNLSGSPLLQLTWAGLVLLLAAKDTLLNATSSHDKVTLNFSVPFNKWQCLIHTVGSECARKLSSYLWQQHTFFKSPFEMKFRCLEGTITSLTWK